jgi:hypothetical protein
LGVLEDIWVSAVGAADCNPDSLDKQKFSTPAPESANWCCLPSFRSPDHPISNRLIVFILGRVCLFPIYVHLRKSAAKVLPFPSIPRRPAVRFCIFKIGKILETSITTKASYKSETRMHAGELILL